MTDKVNNPLEPCTIISELRAAGVSYEEMAIATEKTKIIIQNWEIVERIPNVVSKKILQIMLDGRKS